MRTTKDTNNACTDHELLSPVQLLAYGVLNYYCLEHLCENEAFHDSVGSMGVATTGDTGDLPQ